MKIINCFKLFYYLYLVFDKSLDLHDVYLLLAENKAFFLLQIILHSK